jgi:hypothetical protein
MCDLLLVGEDVTLIRTNFTFVTLEKGCGLKMMVIYEEKKAKRDGGQAIYHSPR